MKKNTEKKELTMQKKLLRIILLVIYPIYAMHSLVISPLYTVFVSDAGMPIILSDILYFLLRFIDIFGFFVSFAVMIYGMCKVKLRDLSSLLAVIFLSPLFKYILKMIISPFVDGIPNMDLILMDLYSLGLSYAFELLQFVLIILFAYPAARKYLERCREVQKAAEYLGADGNLSVPSLVPFQKPLSFKNPLQNGAFVSAVVILVGRLLSRIIGFGFMIPEFSGINQYLLFFLPFFIEVFVSVIGYFFMLYVYISIYTKCEGK